ncbi:MAG: NADH-quinone oxidoreductase subunit C [bacterium]|jgi:NADH-quinone oxidoreductase subunit C
MEHLSIYDLLKETFGDEKVLEHVVTGEEETGLRDSFILLQTESLPEVARFLRDDERTQFDMLHLVSGVDYPEYLESVYHIWSTRKRHWVVLKVRVSKENPRVPSLTSIFPAADWHERETYDLMGIIYEGHPNLVRILCAEGWEGHPLRKDYKIPDHEDLLEKGF